MALIEIRACPTRGEAEVAQGALAAAGIESFVTSDDAGGAYPFPLPGSASLLVEEADAATAVEVLGDEGPPSAMSSEWPELPYDAWSATCDTLHAHTQVLGKLAVVLAPPEPQLQHAALRLTARGWETAPLPAPDGSGAFGVALDLRAHEALVEHVDGRVQAIALTPNRSVAAVTEDLLNAVGDLVGEVRINFKPQETPW